MAFQGVRLGDLLVREGLLTEAQRDEILVEQRAGGGPFGLLAERMFGVGTQDVERCWSLQYAGLAEHVDPRTVEPQAAALSAISRRQAWQFGVLPLRFEGRELIACTTVEHLCRALRFVGWRVGPEVTFVLSDADALGEALSRHYPMGGMATLERGIGA